MIHMLTLLNFVDNQVHANIQHIHQEFQKLASTYTYVLQKQYSYVCDCH